MKRFLMASATAAVVLLGATESRANGRFPASNSLAFSKSNPDVFMLRVTFGLLLSTDHGKNFDWVCEQSIGYSGVEDPMYTATPAGNYLATTFQGVSLSTDKACDWTANLTQQVFIDLASNPADGKDVVAFASSYKNQDDAGNIHFTSNVWETKDEGKTFNVLGAALDESLLGYTLDFTTTDPNRLYVSAVRNPGANGVGLLLTSTDRGVTWTELQIPLVDTERSLYIAAVDPNDAEKVYIRTNGDPGQPARLLVREKATDGGTSGSVRTIYTSKAPLEGFALSKDGAKVWIGSTLDGVLLARSTDYQFVQKSAIQAQCLAVNDDGLYACSNEQTGFILGKSTDDGATFQPALHFCTIRGPLACDSASATAQQCAPIWAAQLDTLGCGQFSSDGGSSDGGALQADGAPVKPSSGGATTKSSSSCSVDVVRPTSGWATAGGAAASLLAAAIAFARRSRRRS